MYRATVKITGQAPLAQSRKHDTPKLDGESHEELDIRTWREKCNYDEHGTVFVPAMAFKQAMDKAAQRLAIQDPDNKRALMTKYFVSDVICEQNLSIGIHKDAMPSIRINANSDGRRGSGSRVPRILPQTPTWDGTTSFLVMDEKVKPEMFERVLITAGRSVGVGQFRPENGGLNGRFNVEVLAIEPL